MDIRIYLILGCIFSTLGELNAYRKRHRHSEGKGSRSLGPMVEIEADDKNEKRYIEIDDESTFDVALEYYPEGQEEKHREDTREIGIDREYVAGQENQDADVHLNEGESMQPLSIVSGVQLTGEHLEQQELLRANFTDDEDLMSGSGSGELTNSDILNDFTNIEDMNATTVGVTGLEPTSQPDLTPFCAERIVATWAPWSPWIQSGDQDIRFRRCQDLNKVKRSSDDCEGDYFQTRACPVADERACRLTDGSMTSEFLVQCDGVNLNDLDKIDNCEYSLYDVTYRMTIGNTLTTAELYQADRKLWCTARDKYVPFYSPHQRCYNNMEKFCKETTRCKYDSKKNDNNIKYNPFYGKTCWKRHVLGGLLPTGIPIYQTQQMICQRFDKESKLGQSFNQKGGSYYATLYDTKRRLPAFSMATVRSLGDEKWPNVPYMIERGLIGVDTEGVVSWYFHIKKKGMTSIREITTKCDIPSCTYGEKQALPSDFDHSGYTMMPLLPPDLVGWDIGMKISTLTMTNIVPLEPTLYSTWRKSHRLVRKFAVETCRIPVETPSQDDETHRQDGHDLPELYLVSGTVAPKNHFEVIGNDVIVPEIIWFSACCAHGANVSSFGLYMRNRFGESPTVVSVGQLHEVLQSSYYENTDEIKIDLYPAYGSLCSADTNDISYKIVMP
ncbi:Endonuclease domain-containing 1 protein [Mactra antiquata]